MAVHHLEAHWLVARLAHMSNNKNDENPIRYPFLALIVSGGHTCIIHCIELGKYVFLGGTMDDAIGESLDKAARLLGIPGGGKGLSNRATMCNISDDSEMSYVNRIPIPLRKATSTKNCLFSYSGKNSST